MFNVFGFIVVDAFIAVDVVGDDVIVGHGGGTTVLVVPVVVAVAAAVVVVRIIWFPIAIGSCTSSKA